MSIANSKTLIVCDTQPLAVEGVRSLLANHTELRFAGSVSTLAAALEVVHAMHASVLMIDRSFGISQILAFVQALRAVSGATCVVWGNTNNAEALRLVQGGVQGLLRRGASAEELYQCLHTVTSGQVWMEEGRLAEFDARPKQFRAQLTAREAQVVELVEQGMRNRDIAENLGIRTGTVKIHLKHIFEKTGCRGRYGLALTGLQEKGMLVLSQN